MEVGKAHKGKKYVKMFIKVLDNVYMADISQDEFYTIAINTTKRKIVAGSIIAHRYNLEVYNDGENIESQISMHYDDTKNKDAQKVIKEFKQFYKKVNSK